MSLMKAKVKNEEKTVTGYYAKVKDIITDADIHVIIPENALLIPCEGISEYDIIDESTLKKIESQDEMLKKCIYGWYKSCEDKHIGLCDEEFMSEVCKALEISLDEYKMLMFPRWNKSKENKNRPHVITDGMCIVSRN